MVVINEIMEAIALPPNFEVVATDRVNNAAAGIRNNKRFIFYNPGWVRSLMGDEAQKWRLYGLMAHEIGHHLSGHSLDGVGSRPPTELEADEFAGRILAFLGADLQQAQSLWADLPPGGSASHPPRDERLAAVERGWASHVRPSAPVSQTSTAPRPAASGPQEQCGTKTFSGVRTRVCVSSFFENSGDGYRFDGRRMFDGRPGSAWLGLNRDRQRPEYIALEFPQPVDLRRFSFLVDIPAGAQFGDYARPRRVDIIGSNGFEASTLVSGDRAWVELQFGELRRVDWVRFVFSETFQGSRYDELAISEMDVVLY